MQHLDTSNSRPPIALPALMLTVALIGSEGTPAVDVSGSIRLEPGPNLISLPLDFSAQPTGADLLTLLGDVDEVSSVSRLNASSQTHRYRIPSQW